MRIRTFGRFVEVSEVQKSKLRNETVVVDGHNFFYLTYKQSGLNYSLGCESDRYAHYLRELLSKFHKANIKCYFLFKGGFQDFQKRFERKEHPPTAIPIRPTFTKNVIMDVMKESNFEYIVCEYESKKDIIELAQILNCPIISFDVEYCFSGHQYIPISTLQFNENDNTIDCGVFILEHFLRKYKLNEDKLATFIVLTDERIYPEDFFFNFFKFILKGKVYGPYKRNLYSLEWLSRNSRDTILEALFNGQEDVEERKKFFEEEVKARQLIWRRERGGLGAAWLLDRAAGRVARADPRWFAKGVAAGHVAIDYVNLYRSKVLYGAGPITGFENPILISLDIIYYAYDLLTDFKNDGFTLIYETDWADQDKQTMKVARTHRVPRPAYDAEVCVFENGWGSVGSLGLLEHFARSALQLPSLRCLERAPEQARLLLLALVYCSRRSPAAPAALPAAALLTHVILDIQADYEHNNNMPKFPFERKPILDSTPDSCRVSDVDCGIVAAIMKEYFTVGGVEEVDVDRSRVSDVNCGIAAAIMEEYFAVDGVEKVDLKLLHPLVEYQSCLLRLCELNALCGAELRAPVLARTYNGTLAYNLLRAAERATDRLAFLDELLSPAPTVYAYFNRLHEIYDDLLFFDAHELQ